MNIKVKDNSSKATKIAVRGKAKPIWSMTEDELIKALDLKKEIIDYHYSVEDRYHEVSDIYSDELVEYVAELLYDYCQAPEYDGYEELAGKLISKLEDEVIEEIYEEDDNAKETYEEIEEARRGEY